MILKIVPIRPPGKPHLKSIDRYVEGAEFSIELHTFDDEKSYLAWLEKRETITSFMHSTLNTQDYKGLDKWQVFVVDVEHFADGDFNISTYTLLCKKLFLLNDKGKTVDSFSTTNPLVFPRKNSFTISCPQCGHKHTKLDKASKLTLCSHCGWSRYKASLKEDSIVPFEIFPNFKSVSTKVFEKNQLVLRNVGKEPVHFNYEDNDDNVLADHIIEPFAVICFYDHFTSLPQESVKPLVDGATNYQFTIHKDRDGVFTKPAIRYYHQQKDAEEMNPLCTFVLKNVSETPIEISGLQGELKQGRYLGWGGPFSDVPVLTKLLHLIRDRQLKIVVDNSGGSLIVMIVNLNSDHFPLYFNEAESLEKTELFSEELKVNYVEEHQQRQKFVSHILEDADLEAGMVVAKKGVSVKPVKVEKPSRCSDVINWCVAPNYLGLKTSIWGANFKLLLDTFQETCPVCSTTLYVGKCVVCGSKPKKELFDHPLNEVVGIRGQRTGNSFLSAIAATYQLHKVLSLPVTLSTYYGLPIATVEMVFVDPGKHTWNYFWELFHASPWFNQYFESLEFSSYSFERPSNEEAVFSRHGTPHLIIRRGGVEEDYRGATRIFATVDNPDWVHCYSTPEKRVETASIYTALKNSMRTLKTVAKKEKLEVQPLLFMLGSPNGKDVKESLLKKIWVRKKKKVNQLVLQQPTWEVNPTTTREQLKEEIKDEIQLRRDFGAEFLEGMNEETLKSMICSCGVPGTWYVKEKGVYLCSPCYDEMREKEEND